MRMLNRKVKMESGASVADYVGTIFVMAFLFAMLFSWISYAKLVNIKLECDNVAKKYIYRMEQYGYMLPEDRANMISDLNAIGVNVTATGYTGTTLSQVKYGDKVHLQCEVSFPNPVYELLGPKGGRNSANTWFIRDNLQPTIIYTIKRTSTSRW